MAGSGHCCCVNLEDDRAAMTRSDCPCRVRIAGQMDMVAAHRVQPVLRDDGRGLMAGAVIQHGRRRGRRELQIYGNAVALIGADLGSVCAERKPLLAVLGDDFFQFRTGDRHSSPGAGGQKRVYGNPAAGRKREAQTFGIMPKVLAEKLADFDQANVIHR